jgi:hypothetical protein
MRVFPLILGVFENFTQVKILKHAAKTRRKPVLQGRYGLFFAIPGLSSQVAFWRQSLIIRRPVHY